MASASVTSSRRRRPTPRTPRSTCRCSRSRASTTTTRRSRAAGPHQAGSEHRFRLGRRLAASSRSQPTTSRCAGRRLRSSAPAGTSSRRSPTTVSGSTSTESGSSVNGSARRARSSARSSTSPKASTRSRWSTSTAGWGALVSLGWDSLPEQPSDAWRAQYWNVPGLGPITIPPPRRSSCATRNRSTTTGGRARPARGIANDRFVARWTRTLSFSPGDYEFAVTADDGVRLYVDGERVIDKWIDQAQTTYRATVPLDGGPHNIVMEYYEQGAGAVARPELFPRRRSTRDRVPGRVLEHAHGQREPDLPDRPPRAGARRRDARLRLGRRLSRSRDRAGPVHGSVDEDGGALGRRLPVQRRPRRRHPRVHRQRAGGQQVDARQRAVQRRQGHPERRPPAAGRVLRARRRSASRVHL